MVWDFNLYWTSNIPNILTLAAVLRELKLLIRQTHIAVQDGNVALMRYLRDLQKYMKMNPWGKFVGAIDSFKIKQSPHLLHYLLIIYESGWWHNRKAKVRIVPASLARGLKLMISWGATQFQLVTCKVHSYSRKEVQSITILPFAGSRYTSPESSVRTKDRGEGEACAIIQNHSWPCICVWIPVPIRWW